MPEKIAFIINPVSGRKTHGNIENIIINTLDELYEPYFFYTERGGHASELAQQCLEQGINVIAAVGGDGTVNEIAKTLIGTSATLAIIPKGSGNGLARHLKIPMSLKGSLRVLNNGKIQRIDVGKVNGHYFFCTCGVGFDAQISKRFATSKKRGFVSYVYWVLKELSTYKSKKYKVRVDGKTITTKAFILSFANANQFGNNFKIAPFADISDGYLDICIFKPFPGYALTSTIARVYLGKIGKSPYYKLIRAQEAELLKEKKYQMHIDGEPIQMKSPIKVNLHKKSLNVVVPYRFELYD